MLCGPPMFFIDIDGVLYSGENVIPGGVESLKFSLLTNTSRISVNDIEVRLAMLGYEVSKKDIITVPEIAAEYLSEKYGIARCFVIGTKNVDLILARSGHYVTREEESVDAVVIGLNRLANFGEIDIARRLVDDGAEPLALNRDPTCPDGDVLRIGAGPIVAALESVITRPVRLLGKPSPSFFDAALRRSGYRRENTIMIGDSLKVDIAGAASAGLRTIFVRTGVDESVPTTPECDWEMSSIAKLPDWYLHNFG